MVEVTDLSLFVNKIATSTNIGYGSVQFNDLIWVDIAIRRATDGRSYVSWPSYKKNDGTWNQLVKFYDKGDLETSKLALKAIENYILKEFNAIAIAPQEPTKVTNSKAGPIVSFKQKGQSSSPPLNEEQIMIDEADDDDEIFNSALFKG